MNKSPIRAVGSIVSARETQSKKNVVIAKQDYAPIDLNLLTDRP